MSTSRKRQWEDAEFAERRSRELREGRSTKNTVIEQRLAEILDNLGYKYEQNARLNGREVDFKIAGIPVVIQVDGCVWHECPIHGEGWKLDQPEVDQRSDGRVKAANYEVFRYWEHDIWQPGFLERVESDLLAI